MSGQFLETSRGLAAGGDGGDAAAVGLGYGAFQSAGADSLWDYVRFFSIFERGESGWPLLLNVPRVCLDRL